MAPPRGNFPFNKKMWFDDFGFCIWHLAFELDDMVFGDVRMLW